MPLHDEDIRLPPPLKQPRQSETSALSNQLADTEASFRLLFTNNPQPMWIYDLETFRFLEVNAAAVSLYGYSREEFLSMRISDIRPAEDLPRLSAEVRRKTSGLRHAGEWRHRHKDGHLAAVEIVSHPLRFSGRSAELIVVHDVTERKRAEEALREAEQRYRSIFEEAVVGIFRTTPDGRFLAVNPTMASMLGYDSAEELISIVTDIDHQIYVDPGRRAEFTRAMQEQDTARNFEFEVYRKDGSKMWLSMNARAVRNGGAVLYYDGSIEDITERKSLQEQLRQSQKMEAMGRLAGGVAHDFNNALAVITGYGDLLLQHIPQTDPLRNFVEEINKAGFRAAGLTRQLLAFSRKQVIQPRVVDLNSVITETEKMLRRLIGEDVEIMLERASDLGRVKADVGQIEQVLMNLVVNARDAMPLGGKLMIATANADLDHTYTHGHSFVTPGRYILLSVSDTGCGMSKETQAHIFEPFFTTKPMGKGTGLGLSTVYGIVKQNGGYIFVYSELGQGSSFKIYLPRVEKTSEPIEAIVSRAPLPGGSEVILLVEDEDSLRKLTRTCLEDAGYTVMVAEDGQSAMKTAKQQNGPIHLLLTDVVMPGTSGRQLAETLSRLRPEIRVLYMSGYTNDLIAHHGVLETGAVLLEKPFNLATLLAKVREALSGGRLGRGAAAGE